MKNAEKILKNPQNLQTSSIKNEDSTNSSESQKVKTVLENYYKEEHQFLTPVNRKEILEQSDEEDDVYLDTKTVLPEDLQAIRKIGSGTFAKVFLCKSMKTGEKYALKVIDKKKLKNNHLVRYAVTEQKILKEVKSDFIVSLKLSFQTKSH